MRQKCILVNPWIYDFSAVNLWSRPLGLLRVAEHLSQYDVDFTLFDTACILRKKKKFGVGNYPREIMKKPEILKDVPKNYARYGMSIDAFRGKLEDHLPCDFIMVTSIMSYWYPGVQKAIEVIRSCAPDTPVVLGGIYATLFYRHAVEHSGADYVFRGQVDAAHGDYPVPGGKEPSLYIETVLGNLGIELARKRQPVPYYKLGLYSSYLFAPVLTSSGCPYKCSYCASSILSGKFTRRDPAEVVNEILKMHALGAADYAFYDDALLVDAETHLKVILREIIHSGIKARFHCPNGIHARFIDDEIAYLMKKSGFTTLRLGFETVNTWRQARTGGKVTSDIFTSAVALLKKQGFKKQNIGVYLMYGLPGQSLDEVKDGVRFLKSLGIRINLTEFSPIPFTACWNELVERGVITDDTDPLLTNNSVFTGLYSGYDPDALQRLKDDVKKYNSSC